MQFTASIVGTNIRAAWAPTSGSVSIRIKNNFRVDVAFDLDARDGAFDFPFVPNVGYDVAVSSGEPSGFVTVWTPGDPYVPSPALPAWKPARNFASQYLKAMTPLLKAVDGMCFAQTRLVMGGTYVWKVTSPDGQVHIVETGNIPYLVFPMEPAGPYTVAVAGVNFLSQTRVYGPDATVAATVP